MSKSRRRTKTRTPKAEAAAPKAAGPSPRTLERRVRELTATLEAERQRHARQLDAVRRAADRKLADMVQEIVALRHHEARAEMLARLLAERDAATAERQETSDAQDARSAGG